MKPISYRISYQGEICQKKKEHLLLNWVCVGFIVVGHGTFQLGLNQGFSKGFCDVAKIGNHPEKVIQMWLHTRYESRKKTKEKRIILHSWLPTGTSYHKNLVFFLKSGEFGPFFPHETSIAIVYIIFVRLKFGEFFIKNTSLNSLANLSGYLDFCFHYLPTNNPISPTFVLAI
jgi:hypothetical protein